ncbi:MAG: Calx-beta domain-containing protein [Bacteroidales bacterium]
MKKNLLNLFIIALIAVAFTACKKDEVVPPTVAFEKNTDQVAENATSALQVLVVADKAFDMDYSIGYSVSGTAGEGVHYETIDTKSVVMNAGETEAVIFINPINQTVIDEDKTLVLKLTAGEEYVQDVEASQIDIVILDNTTAASDAPQVSFTTEGKVTNPYLEEQVEITMGISEAVEKELLVGISFNDVLTEGVDYEVEGLNASNQLVLAANETSASFTVSLKNTHAAGVDKTFEIGFAAPEVTDYAVKESSNTVAINLVDPVVDLSAWFNVDNEFNYFFASGSEMAYRTDLPAYRVKRYFWDATTSAWALLSGGHYFDYAPNDQNQWKEVINIFNKQIGYPGVDISEQERWEVTAGDFLGITRFFGNEATYMKTYISSEENGWLRFVTTDATSAEGTVIIPEQTLTVYKIKEGFDWKEKFTNTDGTESWFAWHADSRENQGRLWESTNVVPVEFNVQRSVGTYNTATATIEVEVTFTVSDVDLTIDPKYYTNKEGDTYTMKVQYIPQI